MQPYYSLAFQQIAQLRNTRTSTGEVPAVAAITRLGCNPLAFRYALTSTVQYQCAHIVRTPFPLPIVALAVPIAFQS